MSDDMSDSFYRTKIRFIRFAEHILFHIINKKNISSLQFRAYIINLRNLFNTRLPQQSLQLKHFADVVFWGSTFFRTIRIRIRRFFRIR